MLKAKIEKMQNDLRSRAEEIEITKSTPVPTDFMKIGDIPCGLLPNSLIKMKIIIDIRKAELAEEGKKIQNIITNSGKNLDDRDLVRMGRHQVGLWKLQEFEDEFKEKIETTFPESFQGRNKCDFSIEIRRDWLVALCPIKKCKCRKTVQGF